MNEQRALLRIPPFPGAKISNFARPRSTLVEVLSDEEMETLAIEVRRLVSDASESTSEEPTQIVDVRKAIRSDLERFEYVDPFTSDRISLAQAVQLCSFWQGLIASNRDIGSAVGFAFWKRATIAPLLWDGSSNVNFTSRFKAIDRSKAVAVWKARTSPGLLADLERSGMELIEVEDGFIRSAGLGADCVPPLSIVVDKSGAHFDPTHPSDLEQIIQNGPFPVDLLDRAARLRDMIIAFGLSKYGVGNTSAVEGSIRGNVILVAGQVEDDRAVLCGGGEVRTNLELLRRVREQKPNAYILYKPHPDVEAGHRPGTLADGECLRFADEIVRSGSIHSVIDRADEVHVISSLAGFEALLRGKPVTTYGVPIYAGWGLTRDLGPIPVRRSAKRSLDELVAAVLLIYPRYLDPVTGLPCPVEVLIERLAQPTQRGGIVVQLRRAQGRLKRLARAGTR